MNDFNNKSKADKLADDIIDGTKSLAKDDLMGAKHWKRSKVGYITGAGVISDTVKNISQTGTDSVKTVQKISKIAFRKDTSGNAISPSISDPKERFREAMIANNKTSSSINASINNTYRQFYAFIALSMATIIFGLISFTYMPFSSFNNLPLDVLLTVVRFFPLPLTITLALRAGYTNWFFRNRSLSPLSQYISSPLSEILPKKAVTMKTISGQPSKNNGTPRPANGNTSSPVKSAIIALFAVAVFALSSAVPLSYAVAAGPTPVTTTPGGADAVKSMLGDPNKGDLFMRVLGNIIPNVGPIPAGIEDQAAHKATANAFAAFSGILLLLGVTVNSYQILTSLVASAKEGKALGQNYHEVWAPVRMVVGYGMLVPAIGGMCAAQLVVLYLASWGGNLANLVWQPYVNTMTYTSSADTLNRLKEEVQIPAKMQSSSVARSVFYMELCNESLKLYEQRNSAYFSGKESIDNPQFRESSIFTDEKRNLQILEYPKICGSMVLDPSIAAPDIAEAITNLFSTNVARESETQAKLEMITAKKKAIETILPILRLQAQLIAQTYQPSAGNAGSEYFSDEQKNSSLKTVLANVERTYKIFVNEAVSRNFDKAVAGTSGNIAKLKEQSAQNGWASSGTFFLTFANINNIASSAINQGVDIKVASQVNDTDLNTKNGYLFGSGEKSGILTAYARWYDVNADDFSGVPITSDAVRTGDSSGLFSKIISNAGMGMVSQFNTKSIPSHAMEEMMSFGNKLSYSGEFILAIIGGTSIASLLPGGKIAAVAGASKMTSAMSMFSAASGWLGSMMFMFALILVALGAVHSFIMPMIPFIMVFFFVAGMSILVVEALIAAPIWALFHIRMDGEEFISQVQRPGYMIVFNMLLRPSLMIFGLMLANLVFGSLSWFLSVTFNEAIAGIVKNSTIGITGFAALIILVSYLHYQAAIRSFQLVTQVPDRVSRWFGQGGEDLGEERDTQGASGAVVAAVTHRTESFGNAAGRMAGGGARGAMREGANGVGSSGKEASTPNNPAAGGNAETPTAAVKGKERGASRSNNKVN